MSNEQRQQQANEFNSEKIDLFELIQSIWQEKLLVLSLATIVTALASAYAFTAKPVYQASTRFYQPPASAIQIYNLGRKEAGFTEYSITDIYNIFLANLKSEKLRKEFFVDVYLPSLTTEQKQAPRSALYAEANRILSIQQVNPFENEYLHQITVELNDPERTADWANLYLQKAIAVSKQEIEDNISAEINSQKKSINLRIDNLIIKAQTDRQHEVIRLKEALSIAETIGLKNPSLPEGKATQEGANYVDRNLTYLRGAKALKSQIHVLETRKDDNAFIPELRDLKAQLNLLNSLPLNYDNAQVVRTDHQAQIPDVPIKPNKKHIIAMGIILGGMLGVFAALIRTAIRQRKVRKVQH